jgi:protein-S-isoprenylcysteine O-methyltransferase Ste14
VRKSMALFGSSVFFLMAPGTVAGAIPWVITRWTITSSDWPQLALLPFAAILVGGGLFVLADSFFRFAVEGFGMPTPILPTKALIVTGLYRYVRNPMYVAVLAVIVGQALLFGSVWLLLYAGIIFAIFHSSVLLYEEPRLRADYSDAFETYCKHVPRWRPRARPWRAG